jgi:hypothetical protein
MKPDTHRSSNHPDRGFLRSMTSDLQSLMQQWNQFGDRAAQVLTQGVATGVHAVSQEVTRAILVTGQWGEAFAQAGRLILQQLIEVTTQALLVRSLMAVGLGGFLGLASGGSVDAALPQSGWKRFATGGANLDTLPALLSPGEYVLRAGAVAELGPSFVSGLNQGLVDLNRLSPDAAVVRSGGTGNLAAGSNSPSMPGSQPSSGPQPTFGPTPTVGPQPTLGSQPTFGATPTFGLHFHLDPASMMKAAMQDPSATRVLVDIVRGSLHTLIGRG